MQTTVLVVEDVDALRGAICRLLHNHGYATLEAPDGRVALEILDLVPTVVVLDLMLPEVSGVEVLRVIRERNLKTRVIIATGAVGGPQLESARALRPDRVIEKPMLWDELVAAIGPAEHPGPESPLL